MPTTTFVGAERFVPDTENLSELRAAAAGCQGCDLYEGATQTVFGEGAARPRLVMVGECPGDVEDQQGRPFVGPAGRLLAQAIVEVGIDPAITYRTNAVKHFGYKLVGKRRIHQTPTRRHVVACEPWLWAELSAIRPEGVLALGGTAGKALFGASFKVTESRGQRLELTHPLRGDGPSPWAIPTIHPSAVLRADDRDAAYAGLVTDLRTVAAALGTSRA